jgi:hypothetical protein
MTAAQTFYKILQRKIGYQIQTFGGYIMLLPPSKCITKNVAKVKPNWNSWNGNASKTVIVTVLPVHNEQY